MTAAEVRATSPLRTVSHVVADAKPKTPKVPVLAA
jgi:hypothetical protein